MKAFSITDVGQKREANQDYVFCSAKPVGQLPNLFLVADGMGGHNAGDYASRFCTEQIVKRIKESKIKTVIGTIESAIQEANAALRNEAEKNSNLEGMGTTLVLATVFEHILYVANIGDSRLYLVNDEIRQITEDHSLVEQMVKTGELKKEDARFHPKKNVITRAIGANECVIPDFFEVNIKKGDYILLCSDGLSNMMDDRDILAIIMEEKENIEKTVQKLVKRANDCGGQDNIAIVLIQID